jgi:hypothetical protein
MKYEPAELEKIENHIETNININMAIKTNHGFIYEIRQIHLGDNNIFEGNGTFSVSLQDNQFDISDIMKTEEEWYHKGDKITFKIIEEIDAQVSKLISDSHISGRLEVFKNAIKIAIDNNVVIYGGKVFIKFGVALIMTI